MRLPRSSMFLVKEFSYIVIIAKLFHSRSHTLDQPWAKCSLFAAAALKTIVYSLVAAFCLKTLFIIYSKAPHANMKLL